MDEHVVISLHYYEQQQKWLRDANEEIKQLKYLLDDGVVYVYRLDKTKSFAKKFISKNEAIEIAVNQATIDKTMENVKLLYEIKEIKNYSFWDLLKWWRKK